MNTYKQLIHFSLCGLLALGLVAALPAAAQGATLFAILVADTAAEDIGEGVSVDLSRMSALVEDISTNTGLELKKILLAGTNLTRGGVANAVDQLTAGLDDVIIFYYSGHGARPLGKTSNWPDLAFDDGFVDFGQILDALQRKQPRFMLALADSCNNFLTPELKQQRRGLLPSLQKQASFRKLFLEQEGYVQACGSEPGEVSYSHRTTGGFFTNNFFNRLTTMLTAGAPDWNDIRTDEITAFQFYTQHPYYEINVQPRKIQPTLPTPTPTPIWIPPTATPRPVIRPTVTPRPTVEIEIPTYPARPQPQNSPTVTPTPNRQLPNIPQRPTRPIRPVRRQRLRGKWKVTWDWQGTPYVGLLTMKGKTGLLRLVYFDTNYQHDLVVDQDMRLTIGPGGNVILQGSDPRLPPDNIPHPYGYSLDTFYGRFYDDNFSIERICDTNGYCTSEIYIERLPENE